MRNKILKSFTIKDLQNPGYQEKIARALEEVDREPQRKVIVDWVGSAQQLKRILNLRK